MSPIASRSLLKKAREGEITAIERLGSIARDTQAADDVTALVQVFMYHVDHELQIAKESNKSCFTAIALPATLSALECVCQLISHWPCAVRSGSDVAVSFALAEQSSSNWSNYLLWTDLTIERSLAGPPPEKRRQRIIFLLDKLSCTVFSNLAARGLLGPKVDGKILLPFTRLWLADMERPVVSTALPCLLNRRIFTPDEFISVAGCSKPDLATICTERLLSVRSLLEPSLTKEQLIIAVAHVDLETCFVHTQIEKASDMREHFLQRNVVTIWLTIARKLVARLTDGLLEGLGLGTYDDCMRVVAILLYDLFHSIIKSPAFVSEALDAGILVLLLSMGILCKQPDTRDLPRLKSMSATVEEILTTIGHHLYHVRILPHIQRAYKDLPGSPPRIGATCHWSEAWNLLSRRFEQAIQLKREWQPKRANHPCENEKCPKIGNAGRFRLRECTRCLQLTVCSKECQRACWPEHLPICNQIQERCRDLIIRPSFLVPWDVKQYYHYVVQQLALQLVSDYQGLIKDHMEEIGAFPPSHIIRIDIEKDPMTMFLEPILNYYTQANLFFFDRSLERFSWDPSACVVCAQFVHGREEIVVFASVGLWKHLYPKKSRSTAKQCA